MAPSRKAKNILQKILNKSGLQSWVKHQRYQVVQHHHHSFNQDAEVQEKQYLILLDFEIESNSGKAISI